MVEVTDGVARASAYVDNFGAELAALDPPGAEPVFDIAQAAQDEAALPDIAQNERGVTVHIDRSRDDNLTVFSKATLSDRYLLPDEDFQDPFARVAMHFHCQAG